MRMVKYYLLEMNTRVQEYPVTEVVTHIDIIKKKQIRIAFHGETSLKQGMKFVLEGTCY